MTEPKPVELPAGQELMASWHVAGGISGSLGRLPVDAPRLVVYSDGLAVSDGRLQLQLSAEEVKNLVGTLRTGLDGLNGTVRADTRDQLADGQDTEIQVRQAGGGMQKVTAYAVDHLRGYPPGLTTANQALRELAGRVAGPGSSAYTADRIRLVTNTYYDTSERPVPWPSGVPVPTATATPGPFRAVDLSGAEAAVVVKSLARAHYEGGSWAACVLPDGTVAGVAWRFLLPHE